MWNSINKIFKFSSFGNFYSTNLSVQKSEQLLVFEM